MRAGNRVDVRLGDKLAREVTEWAEAHDARTSEAVRLLISMGLRCGEPVSVRERKTVPPVNREAVLQLTRVGVNLNQLTRQVNKSNNPSYELAAIRDDLQSTTEQVRRVVQALGVQDDSQS